MQVTAAAHVADQVARDLLAGLDDDRTERVLAGVLCLLYGGGLGLRLALDGVLHRIAQGRSEAACLGGHAAAEENRRGSHRDGDAVRRGCGPE